MYDERRIDFIAGDIFYICNQITIIAKSENKKIIAKFNEIDLIAYPDDGATEAVYQRWKYTRLLAHMKQKYGYDPGD